MVEILLTLLVNWKLLCPVNNISLTTLLTENCTLDKIKSVQKNLDDHQNGQYFCIAYDKAYYWGKALHVSQHYISLQLKFYTILLYLLLLELHRSGLLDRLILSFFIWQVEVGSFSPAVIHEYSVHPWWVLLLFVVVGVVACVVVGCVYVFWYCKVLIIMLLLIFYLFLLYPSILKSTFFVKCFFHFQMFAPDPDSDVDKVEFTFLRPRIDGYWDWPRKEEKEIVDAKFVFFGPCHPSLPQPGKGFRFEDDTDAGKQYRFYKNHFKL